MSSRPLSSGIVLYCNAVHGVEIQDYMTWVIGRAGPFGHAIGISDIRITLQDGSEIDCLQKIYKVAPQLVLGFAGSVAIGLELVAQLGKSLQPPDDTGGWDPHYIAKGLPIGTRQLFITVNKYTLVPFDI